jgi:hypothetical protein
MNATMNKNRNLLHWAALVVATTTLAACGGQSSIADAVNPTPPVVITPDPTPNPTPDPSQPPLSTAIPQGIWQSGVGAPSTASVIVTPSGQVWGVFSGTDTTRLLKGQVASSGAAFTGQGTAYLLGTSTADAATVSVTSVPKTSLSGTVSGQINGTTQTEPFSLAYQSRYDTPVTLASFAGSAWSATLGAGTVKWSIDANGALTGTRTTGCTYTGQLSLRTEAKAVADVSITESCPAVTQMSGVAVKTQDNAGITMLLTTTGDAQGVLVGLR